MDLSSTRKAADTSREESRRLVDQVKERAASKVCTVYPAHRGRKGRDSTVLHHLQPVYKEHCWIVVLCVCMYVYIQYIQIHACIRTYLHSQDVCTYTYII